MYSQQIIWNEHSGWRPVDRLQEAVPGFYFGSREATVIATSFSEAGA